MTDRRLNTRQACELLGDIHRNTLANRVKAGAIPSHRDGNRRYYLESDLLRYMKRDPDSDLRLAEFIRSWAHLPDVPWHLFKG